MRKIAVEEAFITPEIKSAWEQYLRGPDVEPGFAKMGGALLGPAGAPLFERLLDLGAGRLAHMDEVGIDMQVLSLTSPGIQLFDADLATRLAAHSNDVVSEAVRAHPTRFSALTAVAPQDPAAAAREIERGARQLGMRGIIVNSHTRGRYLDQPEAWPILEAAEALDMPIYLHPREPAPEMVAPYLDYGLYFASWGFSAETGLHAMRLILSGVLDRFPKLKIVLGHMGEGIPYYLQRIDNRHALQLKLGISPRIAKKPSEYFRENFWVTTAGVTSLPTLRLCLDVLGSERVLFAADYPYEDDGEAARFIETAPLTADEREKVVSGNAGRLFKLKP